MIYTVTLNPAIDRLIQTSGMLTKKKTNRVKTAEYDLGGKGFHVSHVLSKFGIENIALGFIGSENQLQMEKILRAKQVTHQLIVEKNASTRECIVLIDEESQGSTMVTGSGFRISRTNHEKLIFQLQKLLKKDDMLVLAGSLPPDYTLKQLKEIIDVGKRAGSFIACDLSGDALKLAVKMEVDFIKPNQFELEELLTPAMESMKDRLLVLNESVPYIAASFGEEGSYVVHAGEIYRVFPPKVKEVNDTGAGDVFVGSFLAQLALRANLETAIAYATACSASKVTKRNCTDFDLIQAGQMLPMIKIKKLEVNPDAIS
ncbi:1-phosphofructokinase family hexose kinase [Terribacillus sp. 7520-G]|uniref:1-phosphofructokinase family hexose kinase n=1 Tax=Terribacillus sp. 7520-G TaxID=2025389 RepID=UPI000BA69E63|nr:1-phosphofructokinase family hexose kinase [Terribacillus sp. 7520-G]PAD39702.1 carbohydrate kinase [Terribacillus sp. 7520-G]